jgi:transcriptional regulator with XRE-family HTH domain
MTLLDEITVAKTKTNAGLARWQRENPLRRWRERQPPEGWSRSLLARQLDVSHTAVALWENGTRLPMANTLAKIEMLTGISATQWMEWRNRCPRAKEARA